MLKNLYRYKGFDPLEKRTRDGWIYKNPEIWSENHPLNEDGNIDSDYEDVTTDEIRETIESSMYSSRENQGLVYATSMKSRLLILGYKLTAAGIPDLLSDNIRGIIDLMFKSTRLEIREGSWISARREINKVTVSTELQNLIDTYTLPINQATLIQEIKDRIDLAIQELY